MISTVVIIACLVKIHNLNKIINARVIPKKQIPASYNAICARVTNSSLLNEFVSYHMAQGFLTFIFYGNEDYNDLKYIYSNYGLDLKFKPLVNNVEWDCLLDSAFDPTISHVVIINNDQFIFPLESKYDKVTMQDNCLTLEEFNFLNEDGNLITMNTKREIYTSFENKNAIIPVGKTAGERVRLLRNYSSQQLFDRCSVSRMHGIAKYNTKHVDEYLIDKRLQGMHYKVTVGRK